MKAAIKDVRKKLEQDFLMVRFDQGPQATVDSQNARYVTYTLGRILSLGDEHVMTEGLTADEVASLFYLYLREVIHLRHPKVIEWRSDPEVTYHDDNPHRLFAQARFSMRDR